MTCLVRSYELGTRSVKGQDVQATNNRIRIPEELI